MRTVLLFASAFLLAGFAAAQAPASGGTPRPLRERLAERAELGDAAAQYDLAVGYETGRMGLSKSLEKARYWYGKAADQGDGFAAASLGIMFQFGKGVERDYFQAYLWYERAVGRLTTGDRQTVVEMRDGIAGQLTVDQTNEAKRLAREWLASVQQH